MVDNNTALPVDPTDANDSSEFEQITSHVSRVWLYDRRIVIFKVTSLADAEVDAWAKAYTETITTWPPDRLYLGMQDISYKFFALTPRTRARVTEVYALGKELKGRVAVIVPNMLMGLLVEFFLSTLPHVVATVRLFTSREDGLAWLKECLDSQLPQGGDCGSR
jgi:hypothetical protein